MVDDGSRDGSRALARRFARDDPRFRVVEAPHEGLVPALRRGLDACRGELVCRMDADDWMHRDRLALQARALDTDASLDAVACHVRCFPRQHLQDGMRRYERWLASIDSPRRVFEERFVECPVAHPTLMLRRDRLRATGYRDAGWPEDYDLVLRLLERGRRIGVVPKRLLAWRHHDGRLSRTSDVYAPERFTACKVHYLVRDVLAGHDRFLLWGYGATGRALARELRTHDRVPERIVELHPGRLGQRIHGAPVVSPAALPPPGRWPLLVSVAGETPRNRIRRELARRGYRECVDFVCVA